VIHAVLLGPFSVADQTFKWIEQQVLSMGYTDAKLSTEASLATNCLLFQVRARLHGAGRLFTLRVPNEFRLPTGEPWRVFQVAIFDEILKKMADHALLQANGALPQVVDMQFVFEHKGQG
jgi:hypothetical protein